MDERKLSKELRREGFWQTYVWQDAPGTLYPEPARERFARETALDVPAGTVHSAKMGPQGCRYLMAKR